MKRTQRILNAIKLRQCILIDCDSELPVSCRGLCERCYNRFVSRKRRMDEDEFETFEASAIEKDLILKPGEMRELSRDDSFSKVE